MVCVERAQRDDGETIAPRTRFARAASLGMAAGLLFADGDISAKLVGYGGLWLLAIFPRPDSCCSARYCRAGCAPPCRSPRSRAWY